MTSIDYTHIILSSLIFYECVGIYGQVTQLVLDKNGLMHHCNNFGVTLHVPKGAVQSKTELWIGIRMYDDGPINFHLGDYVPITPVVWLFCKAMICKPIELYLPHHVNLQAKDVEQASDNYRINDIFPLLSAASGNLLELKKTTQGKHTVNGSMLFKYCTQLLNTICVSMTRDQFMEASKAFFLTQAIQSLSESTFIATFCVLFHQKSYAQVRDQCVNDLICNFHFLQRILMEFKNSHLQFLEFNCENEGSIKLSLDPPDLHGWMIKDSVSQFHCNCIIL